MNPLRIESAAEAAAIDERILHSWELHPRRTIVEEASDFMTKAAKAVEAVRAELPDCCRRQLVDGLSPQAASLGHFGF